jgi:hypothetical protein
MYGDVIDTLILLLLIVWSIADRGNYYYRQAP